MSTKVERLRNESGDGSVSMDTLSVVTYVDPQAALGGKGLTKLSHPKSEAPKKGPGKATGRHPRKKHDVNTRACLLVTTRLKL